MGETQFEAALFRIFAASRETIPPLSNSFSSIQVGNKDEPCAGCDCNTEPDGRQRISGRGLAEVLAREWAEDLRLRA